MTLNLDNASLYRAIAGSLENVAAALRVAGDRRATDAQRHNAVAIILDDAAQWRNTADQGIEP